MDFRCRRGEVAGVPYKLTGFGVRNIDMGPYYIAIFLVFIDSIVILQLCKLAISDQAQIALQLTVYLSDVM